LQQSLSTLNRTLSRLQDQAATGQKFFSPGESPTAAIRTIALQRTLERQEHFKSTIQTDQAFLTSTESAMSTAGDAANRAKSLILASIGSNSSDAEREAASVEVSSLIRSIVNSANSQLRGRYLFAGSDSSQPPFEVVDNGVVRYNGDIEALQTNIGNGLQLASNIDGNTAYAALSKPVTTDLNPAVTSATRLSDLLGGRGVPLGTIRVTVDDGVNPAVTQDVNLSGSETIGDVQTRLQAAFGPGALTVDIDPLTGGGLRLAAGGSVQVQDLAGSNIAQRLGLVGGPTPTLIGGDLDPRITLQTRLSTLNGGAGLANPSGSFTITNGKKTATIDLTGAVTVEDLFNRIQLADIDVATTLNADGNGIAISTRLSGASFSISENGGSSASDLGIRTFSGSTLLSDLNRGQGVPTSTGNKLNIQLADGTEYSVDVTGMRTVQDVINAVNGLGNANLQASLNTTGNGITITDSTVGTAGFIIEKNAISTALGVDGSLPGSGSINGRDVNPQESTGILSILLNMQRALDAGDNATLQTLDPQITRELERLNIVRGDVGSRLSFLDDVDNRLEDQNLLLETSLSNEFDADLTTIITQLTQTTTVLQATMQIAGQTQQLSLLNYL
jgi:flagellar hook-associated protein 3 FlgL